MTESTYGLLTNPDDPRHGTVNAYTYHGCRCDRCKEANREATAAARDRRQKAGVPPEAHGTVNAYSNYRCRCAECTVAHTKAARMKKAGRT
jgi:hypothetical protein